MIAEETPMQYRQGDVLLCAVDQMPPHTVRLPREDRRGGVARGELTGHAHAFTEHDVDMFRDRRGQRMFLVIGKGGARLRHEEHAAIFVSEGHYEVRLQLEYTPKETPRRIAD